MIFKGFIKTIRKAKMETWNQGGKATKVIQITDNGGLDEGDSGGVKHLNFAYICRAHRICSLNMAVNERSQG